MRRPFIEKLTELAERDDKIVFIIGDVGFSFCEEFIRKYPKQFKNVGASEQKMINFAVGLASVGFKPMVYTMSNFILLRPHEQVRNNVCYGNTNVKLFGVKGSAAYAFLGYSHNLAEGEEESIIKNWPNLNHHKPETEEEIKEQMEVEYQRKGPAYFSI